MAASKVVLKADSMVLQKVESLSWGNHWEHLIQKEPGRCALSQVMMMKRDDINIC